MDECKPLPVTFTVLTTPSGLPGLRLERGGVGLGRGIMHSLASARAASWVRVIAEAAATSM